MSGYTANQLTTTIATPTQDGQSQRLNQGQAVSAKWWTLFGSDALNTLVEEAPAVVTPFHAKHNLQGGGRTIDLVALDAEVALPPRPVRSG